MDPIKVYEQYFIKKLEIISAYIDYLNRQGKKIAIWGAGQRGKAFLNVFDNEQKRISYIYDLNEKRLGERLQTGHIIVDYKNDEADVVLAMNNAHEMSVKEHMWKIGSKAQVVNVDHIILGDLSLEQIIEPEDVNLESVRSDKVASLTVIYHPDMAVYENIKTYASKVDIAYVYDNSEMLAQDVVKRIQELEHVCYISPLENHGLSKPNNIVADMAIKQGMDWLITFDQDSQAAEGMIEEMRRFANSTSCHEKIGMIAPNITREDNIKYDRYFTYFDKVFQSGAMHRLSVLKEVGGYDENLFIDQVDYEYCTRMRLCGYLIAKVNQAFLKHNLQDDEGVTELFLNGKTMYINKYSSARYYYIHRNNLYCKEKYKETDPVYALGCEMNIVHIHENLEIDENKEEHKEALQQAQEDYNHGVMGKMRS